jgi:hypothetical protein
MQLRHNNNTALHSDGAEISLGITLAALIRQFPRIGCCAAPVGSQVAAATTDAGSKQSGIDQVKQVQRIGFAVNLIRPRDQANLFQRS